MYHLFYQCEYSQKFWTNLKSYWKTKTGENLELCLKDIIIGNSNFSALLNYLIILGKFHIFYKSKLELTIPRWESFVNLITEKYQMEQTVSKHDQSEEKFKSRWCFVP